MTIRNGISCDFRPKDELFLTFLGEIAGNRKKNNYLWHTMDTKVIHLHLNEPFNAEQDFYFGSLKAIYDSVPRDRVGIAYKSLTNAIRGKTEYKNKRCTIKVGHLERKKSNI